MAQAQAQLPHPPLEGAQLVIGTIAVSLAVFMNVLDTSIANVCRFRPFPATSACRPTRAHG